jgi:hypothetical protein
MHILLRSFKYRVSFTTEKFAALKRERKPQAGHYRQLSYYAAGKAVYVKYIGAVVYVGNAKVGLQLGVLAEEEEAFHIKIEPVIGWKPPLVESGILNPPNSVFGNVVAVDATREKQLFEITLRLGERKPGTEIPAQVPPTASGRPWCMRQVCSDYACGHSADNTKSRPPIFRQKQTNRRPRNRGYCGCISTIGPGHRLFLSLSENLFSRYREFLRVRHFRQKSYTGSGW